MNFKILTGLFLSFLFMSSIAVALTQPIKPIDPLEKEGFDFLSIIKPPAPGTSTCTDINAETNSYCSGNIRIYQQCIRTVDGGEWQQKSEDCSAYPNGVCENGVCTFSLDDIDNGNESNVIDSIDSKLLFVALIGAFVALVIIFKVIKK